MKLIYRLAVVALAFALFANAATAEDTTEKKEAPKKEVKEAKQPEKAPRKVRPDAELRTEVSNLFRAGKTDEALDKFKAGLEEFPNSPLLKSLHSMAYSALMRADRAEEALGHLEAYAVVMMDGTFRSGNASSFEYILTVLHSKTEEKLGKEKAEAVLTNFKKSAADAYASSPVVSAVVDSVKAKGVAATGDAEGARSLIAPYFDAIQEMVTQKPDDLHAVRSMMSMYKLRQSVEESIDGGTADEVGNEMMAFLAEKAESNPKQVGTMYTSELLSQASRSVYQDPAKSKDFLATLADYREEAGDSVKTSATFDRQIKNLESTIVRIEKMRAMIGEPAAFPENIDGWVNGEERTPESLKGKVVLIDFFAIWCGPCVSTFPHLNELHDKYSDQGFELIAVTTYYKYDWDEEAKRHVRKEMLEPEAERDAMAKFAKFHELRHPIGYDPEKELNKHYMVSGIPHVVLIDRLGNVKNFWIGAGEKNAHEIEKAVQECLAESAG